MDPKQEAKKIEKASAQAAQAPQKKQQDKEKKAAPKVDMRQIIRVLSADLDGSKKIKTALCNVRGINYNFSHAVLAAAKIDGERKLNQLTEQEINLIETVAKDPVSHGIPSWMINKRFDYKTGENRHLTGADLMISLRDEINRLKKIRSYRGVRHEVGLTVRGQRTRTAGRSGARVGVIRSKELREKAKGAGEEKKK